jgi:ubiquinol-cytochrome c reductase cytochrome b subunit
MRDRLFQWLDRRLGITSFKVKFLDEPIPGGARFAYVFGSSVLFLYLVQLVTGIALMFFYAPTVDHAWESTKYILEEVDYGWLILSLHYWGGSAMVALLGVHILQVFTWGAYKAPRELVWISGVFLLLLALIFGFTGYLLPWDQKAYWATTVSLELLDKTPLIGDGLARFLKGGATLGLLSLSRFFVIHAMLLPFAITVMIALHLYLMRKAGPAGPYKGSGIALKADAEAFYPGQVSKDLVFAVLVLVILLGVASLYPPEVLPKASAEPTEFNPEPEWYFLWYFKLLQLPFFSGERGEFIGGIVVPLLVVALLIGLPFIDRGAERNPGSRPVAMSIMALFLTGFVTLTALALMESVG